LAGQIRERKWDDHHIACYKSFHASSSAGEDQSSAQTVWAKGNKDSPLGDDAAFRLFKKAKKSRTSRRVSSGTLYSSAISIADDTQVKKPTYANRQGNPPEFIQKRGGNCQPPKARIRTLRQPGNRIVRLSAKYGLIAICSYVSGLALRARKARAGFRFVGTPRSSSAPLLSDANGKLDPLPALKRFDSLDPRRVMEITFEVARPPSFLHRLKSHAPIAAFVAPDSVNSTSMTVPSTNGVARARKTNSPAHSRRPLRAQLTPLNSKARPTK
jgi:hypothetical protein